MVNLRALAHAHDCSARGLGREDRGSYKLVI